jgi:hypothetical protein
LTRQARGGSRTVEPAKEFGIRASVAMNVFAKDDFVRLPQAWDAIPTANGFPSPQIWCISRAWEDRGN